MLDKLKRLIAVYKPMEDVRILRVKYQILMFEPRLLFRYKKDWIAFLIATRLYRSYENRTITMGQAKEYIRQIAPLDKNFSVELEKLLPPNSKEEIIAELLGELPKGRAYFARYLITNAAQLIEKAKALKEKNPELSQKLTDLIAAASGHEADVIARYKTDCESWITYATKGQNIDFFIQRIYLFLNGGFYGNTKFEGIYSSFGDEETRKDIIKSNAARNLMFYNQQLRYLYSLLGMCIGAQSTKDWKGFRGAKGFWTDFDKYALAFEKGYGNSAFREELEREKQTGNELPQFWGGEWQRSGYHIQDIPMLDRRGIIYLIIGGEVYTLAKDGVLPQMLKDIRDKQYLVRNFVHPAAEALKEIFDRKLKKLLESRNQALRDLIRLLIMSSGLPRLGKVRRLLKRKKSYLFKKLEIAITEFAAKSISSLQQYQDYNNAINSALAKVDPDFVDGNIIKALESTISNLLYLSARLKTDNFDYELAEDKKIYGRILYANTVAEAADNKRIMLERMEHLSDVDLQRIDEIVNDGQNVLAALQIVKDYINIQLEKGFLSNPAEASAAEFSEISNKAFEIGFIRKQFDAELERALSSQLR